MLYNSKYYPSRKGVGQMTRNLKCHIPLGPPLPHFVETSLLILFSSCVFKIEVKKSNFQRWALKLQIASLSTKGHPFFITWCAELMQFVAALVEISLPPHPSSPVHPLDLLEINSSNCFSLLFNLASQCQP